MHTSTQSRIDDTALAGTHQVHGAVDPGGSTGSGPKVLELAGLLQTTLDLEQQIQLFTKSLRGHIDVDGLRYTNPDAGIDKLIGSEATHKATYDIKLESTPLGSIRIFRELPFSNSEIQLLEDLLCGLVYPLRNSLSYLQALRLASHDPLTGVQNRLAMTQALEREVDLARRQKAPLSMLLIDADHFKRFNDEFGHAFGDDVLRALAQAVSATIRRSDLLFRYGGEEFVVLASHTNGSGAELLGERIREAIAHIRTIRGRKVALSVSIGVAQLSSEELSDGLFVRADNAMYRAKSGGRNQVVIAD